MARCAVCQCSISFFDSHRLSDGRCCPSCLTKSGIMTPSVNHSSFDVRRRIERLQIVKAAADKIRVFYAEQLKAHGFIEGEHGYGILTNNKDYRYWIINGVLYQVDDEYDYNGRFDVSNAINSMADVENLQPKDLGCLAIPVENIQYFAKEGDVQYTTKISGGGGGGSSISGALVGGLIAGEAGAIIGSRQKVNPITSTTQRHDTTQTILKYHDGDGLATMIFKGFKMYDFFLKMIPEKDLLSVQLQTAQKNTNADDIREKLKTIKSLFEDGLIDEAEYSKKRQELLKQI